MRSIFTLLAFPIYLASSAQSDSPSTLTVIVENISSEEGKVYFGLYSAKSFMKTPPEFTESSEITNGTATVTFKNVSVGKFAITAFNDNNGNQMMDFEPS